MAYTNPGVDDFKSYFYRDFPYGINMEDNVLDEDIAKAFQQTNINFNADFWSDQASYSLAYLQLTAHYLVMNLRTSSQGINGQFNWLEQSKSVSGVSSSFAIPQRILDNPFLSMLTKTNYGSAYLQLILPQLGGYIYTVRGTTTA